MTVYRSKGKVPATYKFAIKDTWDNETLVFANKYMYKSMYIVKLNKYNYGVYDRATLRLSHMLSIE